VATTAYTLTRPLVGRIATKHVTISTCSLLQTIQLGVGIPQGCGAVVQACREYTSVCSADNTVDRALVKVDIRNDCNSVRRDVMLREIGNHCPDIFTLVRQA